MHDNQLFKFYVTNHPMCHIYLLLLFSHYYLVNLRKIDTMVNSTGSNNETELSIKCTESAKHHHHHSDNGHQLEDGECDVIGNLIGDYGKWQLIMTFLLALFQVPNTFHIYSPTFQVIL